MPQWSTVEAHLRQNGVEFTRTNLAGTNVHKVVASVDVMGQQKVAEIYSSPKDDRFAADDLRAFFRALGIGVPSWL